MIITAFADHLINSYTSVNVAQEDIMIIRVFVCVCMCVCVSQQSQVKESSQALPVQMDVPVEEGEGELPVRYERDLVQKLKVLRHELSLQQPQAGHCRIEVSREEIFEVEQLFFCLFSDFALLKTQ